jgi:hypothetical protein
MDKAHNPVILSVVNMFDKICHSYSAAHISQQWPIAVFFSNELAGNQCTTSLVFKCNKFSSPKQSKNLLLPW